MNDERLLENDLKDAFRSVRDAYDGSHPEANATLQRALFRTRKQAKKQRLTRWVALPIAATLAASTAWAGVTGRLTPVVETVLETLHVESGPVARAPIPTASPRSEKAADKVDDTPAAEAAEPVASAPEPAPAVAPEPAPAVEPVRAPAREIARAPFVPRRDATPTEKAERPSAPAAVAVSPDAPVAAEPPKPAADPQAALFAEAHRLHFIERDPARALAAWDQYLAAAKGGRFVPEARYNRALALVRLGRTSEAKAELEAFASGTYGSYRQGDAKALLDALARDGR